jgi:hypothetical protein
VLAGGAAVGAVRPALPAAFFSAFVSGSVFAAFSGTGGALVSSGTELSSSGGRDTPVLSDGLFCVFGVLAGIGGASDPA